jgi:hypothetical protein
MSPDYRLTENRREAFVRWMAWSIIHNDCDPSIYLTNYLFDRFEHNLEQKLWICWIFGTTYHVPATWVIWNEMPDFALVDKDRLEDWNSHNYKRLRYQTDTKYNKGFLPQQYASYRDWVYANGTSQREALRKFVLPHADPKDNFRRLFGEVSDKMYKFGRYTSWFYLQTLKQCAGVNIEPPNLLLADSGSRSHRNGMCYAVGKDNWVDTKIPEAMIAWMECEAASMLEEVRALVPQDKKHCVDFFAMETCLCSFKKLFRVKRGRYLGYYLDRQAEEISKCQTDGWSGIDWNPFWDARTETIDPRLLGGRIQEERMAEFVDIGCLSSLEYVFSDAFASVQGTLEEFFA